jgi:hypothetical protein
MPGPARRGAARKDCPLIFPAPLTTLGPLPGDLPFIDNFDTTVDASPPAVYEALARHLGRSLGTAGARVACRILGCAHRGASLSTPPVEGQEASGFVVAGAEAPDRLVLEGRHRFASYRLSFTLDPLPRNRTKLSARTDALFPGFTGGLYRALVIGSGGHEIVARRMLAAVARGAERLENGR